jgi:hypothetical protein
MLATVTPATRITAPLAVRPIAPPTPDPWPIFAPAIATPPITVPRLQPLALAISNSWLDTKALMAVTDPILLPGFTLPGDEVSALMLPATPEISYLPQAFSDAARRFIERPPSIITFIDPATGQPTDDPSSAAPQPEAEQSWLLVDANPDDNIGALSSSINWDSHPK